MSRRLIPAVLVALTVAGASAAWAATGAPSHAHQICPRDDRSPDRSRMRPGAPATPLVPRGALMLTICDYNGMNATPSTPQFALLGADQTRSAATIRRVTGELDALKPAHGVTSCPLDDANEAVLSFYYYGSADVTVDVGTKGCNEISSGKLHRMALGAAVVPQIEQLAKPVSLRWATVVGQLRLCGGPYPGRCHIENYERGDRVVVHAPGDPWLAMAPITYGRFRFRVAASGTYTFALYADNTLIKKLRRRIALGPLTRVVFLIPVP